MILDALLQLSSAQAVTSADAYSTNTIDFGDVTPKRRVGTGEPLSLVIVVTTAAAADGSSFTDTFDFMLVESAAAALTSHRVLAQRRIAAALLVAGYMFSIPMPHDEPTLRYVGARYELGTDDTISVSAYLVPTAHVANFGRAYAAGYAID